MEEVSGPERPPQDKIIANLLQNLGSILFLVGLEPLGQYLIIGTRILSYSWIAVIIFIGLLLFAAGYLWPPSKLETRTVLTRMLLPIASRPRLAVAAVIFFLWSSGVWQISSLRSDLNVYVLPRMVEDWQTERLRQYLASQEPQQITVKVNSSDEEATMYAGHIVKAMELAKWTVIFDASDNEPKPRTPGLCVQETKSPNDPKNNPANILLGAFQAAGIEVSCGGRGGGGDYNVFVLIGKRPLAINRP